MKGVASVLAKSEPRYRRPEHIAAVSWRILKELAEPDPDPAARALVFEQRAHRAEVLLRKLRKGVLGIPQI